MVKKSLIGVGIGVVLSVWLFSCWLSWQPSPPGVFLALWPQKKEIDLRSWYQSGSGSVIVVYIGALDWPDLQPWAEHWAQNPLVKAVLLVDYGEEATPVWEQLPAWPSHGSKVWCMGSFNGSLYRVMPPGMLPAAYVIPARGYAQGPYQYYDELPVPV